MKKAEKTLRITVVAAAEALSCGTILSLLSSGDHERLLLAIGTLLLVLVPACWKGCCAAASTQLCIYSPFCTP